MKRFGAGLLLSMAAALLVGLVASCQMPLGGSLDGADARIVTDPLAVVRHVYDKGSFNRSYSSYDTAFSDNLTDANVDTGAWIRVEFNRPIDTSAMPTSLDDTARYPVTVTRTRDNKLVKGWFELRDGNMTLVFRPAQRHWLEPTTGTEGTRVTWDGIKPNTGYKVVVAGVKDASGGALTATAANTWSFTTIDLDYGLYFMSKKQPDGFVYTEKYVPGRANKFFTPSAKTMVYTHGYEKNAVINDYRRENLLYFITKGTGTIPLGFDTLQYIADDGWNFGVFYWDQFADEPDEVKNIEAKIWNVTNGFKGMRYRVQTTPGTGEYRTANQPTRPLGEEFFNVYKSALAGNTAAKRILGHSTGAQLAASLARRVSDAVTAGSIAPSYLPSRLTFLEGFWSKDSKTYFKGVLGWTAGMTNANATVSIVNTLKSRHPSLAIEQDKHQGNMCGDSMLSIGDANWTLRTLTCVNYVYPTFIGTSATNDTGDRHCYARLYYFWTYSPAVTSAIEAGGGITSRTSDSTIAAKMNKTGSQYMFKQTAGTGSADPSDDKFSRVALAKY